MESLQEEEKAYYTDELSSEYAGDDDLNMGIKPSKCKSNPKPHNGHKWNDFYNGKYIRLDHSHFEYI